jgi:predicted esterase
MSTKRREQPAAGEGRLRARPGHFTGAEPGPAGLHPLGLATGRDGLVYVPADLPPGRPAPLAVMLHGAGGNAQHGMALLRAVADAAGLILLAPDSRAGTWDVIRGGFGPDVDFLDRALVQVFGQYSIDPARVAVGGFSDGASYALSLGLANGDLFTRILAFSPGFMAPPDQRGEPRIYVSHGTGDDVLPIDRCSRRLVPQLRQAGYEVLYEEFDGPHIVPPRYAREATDWFLGTEGGADG